MKERKIEKYQIQKLIINILTAIVFITILVLGISSIKNGDININTNKDKDTNSKYNTGNYVTE